MNDLFEQVFFYLNYLYDWCFEILEKDFRVFRIEFRNGWNLYVGVENYILDFKRVVYVFNY